MAGTNMNYSKLVLDVQADDLASHISRVVNHCCKQSVAAQGPKKFLRHAFLRNYSKLGI